MFKKIILLLFICMIILSLRAQEYPVNKNSEGQAPETLQAHNEPIAFDVYLGVATGINYSGLLGFTGEFNIYNNFTFAGAVGLGSWGYKFFGDLRYYKSFPGSLYFAGGINYSTGIPEIELEMETSSGSTETIKMEFDPVTNIDMGIGYAWTLGRRVRFSLEIGYAVDITSGDCYKVMESQPELSDLSKKTLDLMKPGGFRFGLGFNVGL